MRYALVPALLLLALVSLMIITKGCGKPSVSETLDQADAAFRQEKNYDEAIQLFGQVLNWEGDGEPTGLERFKASLGRIRCKIMKKDFDSAKDSLAEMHKSHGTEVTYKHYCTFTRDMINQGASTEAIDLLETAKKQFPTKVEEFNGVVEMLKKMDLSNDDLQRLKGLGYL